MILYLAYGKRSKALNDPEKAGLFRKLRKDEQGCSASFSVGQVPIINRKVWIASVHQDDKGSNLPSEHLTYGSYARKEVKSSTSFACLV